MSVPVNFSLPEQQAATIQIGIVPVVNIDGWTIRWDQLFRFNSPQPLFSLWTSSGYTNGESGITMTNAANGVFSVSLFPSQVSGVSQETAVLAHQSWRINSGVQTPINGGYRTLTNF